MGKVDSHRIEGCSRGGKAQRFKNRLGDRKADPACRQGQNLRGTRFTFPYLWIARSKMEKKP